MSYQIINNFSLKEITSFHVPATCDYYVKLDSKENLIDFLKNKLIDFNSFLILGGGSNILFTSNYKGIIIHPEIKGIEVINEKDDNVYIKTGCGENWDNFVEYCVNKGFGGIENLSYIPGNVGAVPVQNIGAYGVEAKDIIEKVIAVDIESGKEVVFLNHECKFGYRKSIFKNELINRYIIYSVIFKLNKTHHFITDYGKVREELNKYNEISIQNIRKVIKEIRLEKLPDPELIGNAGSFFKNPVVSVDHYNKICSSNPECPSFNTDNNMKKIPAAWLIEQCGWKGYREGDAGVYPHQPLVLVNYGNATGKEIFQLSQKVKESVLKNFGIELETEVIVIQ